MKTAKKSTGIWPFIIVGMLLAHVGGMMVIVTLCQRNKPPVIENYYDKAINWDRDRANAETGR